MYIARDKCGSLFLFYYKPIRDHKLKRWVTGSKNDCRCFELNPDDYDIDWNDEPREVGLYINDDRLHTVKVEVLDRLAGFEHAVEYYNNLPWYKKIFKFKI